MTIQIISEGILEAADYFRLMPEASSQAASMAINQVTKRKALPMAADTISDQLAFPKGYLTSGDRLAIGKYAKPDDLESIVKARQRATSLARFAQTGAIMGKAGVTVEVKRGNANYLKNAWLVRLKRGASLTQDNYNVGLAVRIKPGESIVNKREVHKSWLVKDKVALLYGPSVDQAFRIVADQMAPKISNELSYEFQRQFDRLTK